MIFAKNFARNYEKKIILGTSDAWSMSLRPIDPATQRIILKIVGFCINPFSSTGTMKQKGKVIKQNPETLP